MSLLPPPSNFFESREALLSSVKQWAASHGYAVIIARSKPGKVYLKCDRGGRYRNRRQLTDETRKRQTGTRLVECPFSAVGVSKDGSWSFYLRNHEHNHEASTTQTAHPSLRQLDSAQRTEVVELSRAGVAPRTIATYMRNFNANVPVTVRDIYNARQDLRTESLAGRMPIQALLAELDAQELFRATKVDIQGHLTHLFFAFREAVQLYEAYHEVLLLDCTYKTNRFNMPLLNIIGITGLRTTFYLAYVFLRSETEDDYKWALQSLSNILPVKPKVMVTDRELALMNAIQQVFPTARHLLCQWHIQKNVLARCKPLFTTHTASDVTVADQWTTFMQAWTTVIRSLTIDEFDNNWAAMKEAHRLRIHALRYLEATWIPWKERFAFPWTQQCQHFGTVVTSRVESAHATLKRYLQVSTGDLHTVYGKIMTLFKHHQAEFQAAMALQRSRVPHKINRPLFAPLIGHISNYALQKMYEELEKSARPDYNLTCTGTFQAVMGMPCGHTLRHCMNNGLAVYTVNVHRHWHFDPQHGEDTIQVLLDPRPLNPLVVRTRGRPKGSTTTRRAPSQFEHVERAERVTRSSARRQAREEQEQDNERA